MNQTPPPLPPSGGVPPLPDDGGEEFAPPFPPPGDEGEEEGGRRPSYAYATRKPVAYLPVVLRERHIGYLWAGVVTDAAGFVRFPDAVDHALKAPETWSDRLADSAGRGVPALQAIRSWIGAPEHPEGGAVPADAVEQYASSTTELWEAVDPSLVDPVLDAMLPLDGEFPDGTPVDRSHGWGPLEMRLPPGYPETPGDGPVRYLTAVQGDLHLGYVWASEDAASFVERADAALAGQVARGAWRLRLRELFEQGVPPAEVLERCAAMPEDSQAGTPLPAVEQAPSLRALADWAGRYQQSMPLARPPRPDDLEAWRRPGLSPEERDAVLRYLRGAPVVFDGGFAPDAFAPDRPERVPDVHRTDGVWIWSEAVAHHLQHHGITPEPGLLEHIRANGHRVPPTAGEAVPWALTTLTMHGVLRHPPV
ncbi:hypothetical protein [Actinomadura kijaniata]|uniref:hypothetical protein n=1 Tax=Actinomadura kijaniata TaxID=46161 RepID=UPI000AF23BC2|nr:hypothetical protein [Actinomadura kijaniata]